LLKREMVNVDTIRKIPEVVITVKRNQARACYSKIGGSDREKSFGEQERAK
jgi:hypothetical protein